MPDGDDLPNDKAATPRIPDEPLRPQGTAPPLEATPASIAHDLNNVIAVILGNAELARYGLQDKSPVLASLDEIVEAALRGRDLVQKLVSLHRGQAATPRAAATPAASPPPPSAPARNRRVLYIDDDPSLVYLVTRMFARSGHQLQGFCDPQEALAVLRADPGYFDLVVSDYNMPRTSGLEVAIEVRAVRQDLPVIVVSGFVDEKLKAEAAAAGVLDVHIKADAVEDLCATIGRLLGDLDTRARPV